MVKAFCYGKQITEVVDFIGDGIIVFRAEGEKYNLIAMIKDVILIEEKK